MIGYKPDDVEFAELDSTTGMRIVLTGDSYHKTDICAQIRAAITEKLQDAVTNDLHRQLQELITQLPPNVAKHCYVYDSSHPSIEGMVIDTEATMTHGHRENLSVVDSLGALSNDWPAPAAMTTPEGYDEQHAEKKKNPMAWGGAFGKRKEKGERHA